MELTSTLFANRSLSKFLKDFLTGQALLNPLRLTASAFLILSPFLTWITIVSVVVYQKVIVFGSAAQSTLLMVASDQFGTNASGLALTGAIVSILLLVTGGFLVLRSLRLGLTLSIAGLLAYVFPFYPLFGSESNGLQLTFISPGIGVFVAGTGVLLGVASTLTRSEPVLVLLQSVRTRRGLAALGASIGTIGISLDALNHAALGQFSDFIGLTPFEQLIHIGLIAGIASTLALVLVKRNGSPGPLLFVISGATLSLLGVDSVNSYLSGNLQDFLGHNLTETVLHLSVYYGVAFAFIASLLRQDRP